MPVTLTALQCPPIQVYSGLLSVAAGGTTLAGNAPSQEPVTAGQTSISATLRRNMTRIDLLGRYGGGLYAVAAGLSLSVPPSGLLLPVSAGHAMCDGTMVVEADTTIGVPDNQNRVWIWLQRGTPTGGPLLQFTVIASPPAGAMPSVLLGSCKTSGGRVQSVDTSGVMYLRGSMGWRQTADNGAPGDTPPSGIIFLAATLGGSYLWDGHNYTATGAAMIAGIMADQDDYEQRLDAMERKFRALLLALTLLFGQDVLTTNELANDLEVASKEA